MPSSTKRPLFSIWCLPWLGFLFLMPFLLFSTLFAAPALTLLHAITRRPSSDPVHRWPFLILAAIFSLAGGMVFGSQSVKIVWGGVALGAGLMAIMIILPFYVMELVPRISFLRRKLEPYARLRAVWRLILFPALMTLWLTIFAVLSPYGTNFTPFVALTDVQAAGWLSFLGGPALRLFGLLFLGEVIAGFLRGRLHIKFLFSVLCIFGVATAAWVITGDRVFGGLAGSTQVNVLIYTHCDIAKLRAQVTAFSNLALAIPFEEMCSTYFAGKAAQLAQDTGVPIVSTYGDSYNSLKISLPDGKQHIYHKRHIVTGFESMPSDPESVPIVVEIPKDNLRVKLAICNDGAFPHYMRLGGHADLIVLPSNDVSPFWSPTVSYGMLARASEAGSALVRPTLGGLTAAASAFGRVTASSKNKDRCDEEDTAVLSVPVYSMFSPFQALGGGCDAILYLACVATCILAVWRDRKAPMRVEPAESGEEEGTPLCEMPKEGDDSIV